MNRREIRKNGFTLVEMLVVILIIGVLASILITSIVGVSCRARATTAQNMIRNIKNHLVQYRRDKGRYPPENAEAGSEPLYEALSEKKGRGQVYKEFDDKYVNSEGDNKKIYSIFGKESGYHEAYEIHYALPRAEEYENMWRYDGEHPSPDQLNDNEVNLWTAGCSFTPDNEEKDALYEINNFE